MINTSFVQKLEETACRAMPALTTRHYDGWLLRCSGGYTRRANAIYPLYGSSLGIDEKLAFCETIYTRQQQPVIFKLTEASQPPDLEAMLTDRGYAQGAIAHLQTIALEQANLPVITTFPGGYRLTAAWLKTYSALNQVPQEHHDTLRRMLEALRLPAYYAMLTDEAGKVSAVGLAVHDEEFVGIFDVVVSETHRRRGIGRQLMQTLLAWGKTQGAKIAYLQVNDANPAAKTLYQQLGFQEAYHYWYRQLSVVPTAV